MANKVEVLAAQSCPTLCNPMDHSPTDSSVHGILQARILEWSGRSPGEGNGNPLQYSCLENPTEELGGLYSPWSHKELDMTEQLIFDFISYTLKLNSEPVLVLIHNQQVVISIVYKIFGQLYSIICYYLIINT